VPPIDCVRLAVDVLLIRKASLIERAAFTCQRSIRCSISRTFPDLDIMQMIAASHSPWKLSKERAK